MQRIKSQSSLPEPTESISTRGFMLLQKSQKESSSQSSQKPLNNINGKFSSSQHSESEDGEKSFTLSDSVLFTPSKDSGRDEGSDFNDSDLPEFSSSSVQSMKKFYVSAMKDLRKGFQFVCQLVAQAVAEIGRHKIKENVPTITRRCLIHQRFWVQGAAMQSRFPLESIAEEETIEPSSLVQSQESTNKSPASEPKEDNGNDASVQAASADGEHKDKNGETNGSGKKATKKRNRFAAKRTRRFHFQVLLRIAFMNIMCEKKLIICKDDNPAFAECVREAADLIRTMAIGQKFDFIWAFMESEIEFRCGNSPIVRKIICEICDELLIPIPVYKDKNTIRKRKNSLSTDPRPSAPVSSQPAADSQKILSLSQRSQSNSAVPMRRLSSQTFVPLDTKKSLTQLSNSLHRFTRQRSAVDFSGTRNQPVRQSLPAVSLTQPVSSQNHREASSLSRRTLSFPVTSTPVKSPKRSVAISTQASLNRNAIGMVTPERRIVSQPAVAPSPIGTPYRYRQDVMAHGKSPAGTGIARILTAYSPFKKRPDPNPTPDSVRRKLF